MTCPDRQANLARVAALLSEMRQKDGIEQPAQRDPLAHLAELRKHYAANPATVSPSLLRIIKPERKEAAE